MASSSIEIMNRGLAVIGAGRITGPTDDSKEARAASAAYNIALPLELRANIWSFAVMRAQLPALVTPPVFGFSLAYNLPADCLRVVQVGNFFPGLDLSSYRSSDHSEFMIEGRQILTGKNDGTAAAPSLNVRYVYLADPSIFDACFVEALACRVGIMICTVITESSTKIQEVEQLYAAAIATASMTNAIELPPSPAPDDTWLMSRNA